MNAQLKTTEPAPAPKLTTFGLAIIVLIALALAARLTAHAGNPPTTSTQTASQQ